MSDEVYEVSEKRKMTYFRKSKLENAPFFQETLCIDMNYAATNASIETILQGNYIKEDINEVAQKFIHSLQQSTL